MHKVKEDAIPQLCKFDSYLEDWLTNIKHFKKREVKLCNYHFHLSDI